MAITREKKEQVVARVAGLAAAGRLIVLARYSGLSVADMQQLRREAREAGVSVLVAKNRLVRLALSGAEGYKDADLSALSGQLALAIGEDEVAPAQAAAAFARTHPALEIAGGITREGRTLSADEVKSLAALPGKDALRAQLVGTIAAPLSGFVGVLSGNLRSLVYVLNARAEAIK
jgi:large subunit ribosomal protein L10